jgi:hypothetical protein
MPFSVGVLPAEALKRPPRTFAALVPLDMRLNLTHFIDRHWNGIADAARHLHSGREQSQVQVRRAYSFGMECRAPHAGPRSSRVNPASHVNALQSMSMDCGYSSRKLAQRLGVSQHQPQRPFAESSPSHFLVAGQD